jgi:putative acetyltransferase
MEATGFDPVGACPFRHGHHRTIPVGRTVLGCYNARMIVPPDAVSVRSEMPDDAAAIDEIVSAAFLAEFGTTNEAQLIRTMRERGELVVDLTLVAEFDGRIVGHIAFSEVTLDGLPSRGLGLGPVAVAPDVQTRGVGSLLISAALERAERSGWQFAVLLGHPTYYPRFGFTPAAAAGITGDYGNHDGWMARSLGGAPLPSGHVRYCSAFHD